MKHYEEYTVETVKKFLSKTTCDKCGEVLPRPGGRKEQGFTLEAATTESYLEGLGEWQDGWRVDDLCSECIEWLFHTLVEAGVHITHFHNG